MYHDDDDMMRRRTQRLDRLRRQREWINDELFDDMPPLRYRSRSTGSISPQLAFLVLILLIVAVGGFWFMQRINELGSSVPSLQVIVQTPTPQIISGTAVVQRIQQLSRLETSKYTIERVIDIRQGSNIPIIGDWLAGDAILLIAHGTVVVGVDLSQLTTDDVTVSPDGQRITVRLPPVQVLSATLDNSKTRVYSRERGLFAPENPNLETLARQTAEQQILQAACEDGIMEQGTRNAEIAIRQFLGLIDNVTVEVITSPPGECRVMP
ncbi:MAG: hypothetical protein C0184_13620 [Chloroflexus aggregans]|uniref:DUF4230 domain-containing protein n=2 Tax=Chloroflexus TaxID=1107 RepID=A0A2J6WX49_9CHLR|nr:MAG: hypothetical protein C0184_13620 [Chloroflexus aggregans]